MSNLTEAILAASLGVVTLLFGINEIKRNEATQKQMTESAQLNSVAEAAQSYVANNQSALTLQAVAAGGSPITIPLSVLVAKGYLPTSLLSGTAMRHSIAVGVAAAVSGQGLVCLVVTSPQTISGTKVGLAVQPRVLHELASRSPVANAGGYTDVDAGGAAIYRSNGTSWSYPATPWSAAGFNTALGFPVYNACIGTFLAGTSGG